MPQRSELDKSISAQSAVQPGLVTGQNNQYLTFITAQEEYGIEILCVQEIRGWEPVTPLPNSPAHLKGVINLRGNIVPIVDLRLCFGLEEVEYTSITVVIVLRLHKDSKVKTVGIVVDGVSDVYTVTEDEMRPPPEMGNGQDTSFIKGLVSINDKLIILLNVEKLSALSDLKNITLPKP